MDPGKLGWIWFNVTLGLDALPWVFMGSDELIWVWFVTLGLDTLPWAVVGSDELLWVWFASPIAWYPAGHDKNS